MLRPRFSPESKAPPAAGDGALTNPHVPMKQAYCSQCCRLVPTAKRVAGRAVTMSIASALGASAQKGLAGILISAATGYLVGEMIDSVADRVCGDCGHCVSG